MSPPPARSWTCDDCGVTVKRIDGGTVELPESWDLSTESLLCLICRRARAGEAAQDALAEGSGVEARAKARRSGVIEFEVRRTPESTDRAIANACRTSAASVATTRERLRLSAPLT